MTPEQLDAIRKRCEKPTPTITSDDPIQNEWLLEWTHDRNDLVALLDALEAAERRIDKLRALLVALEIEHQNDSYGGCVRCYKSHTDDGRQSHPCATLCLARAALADEGKEVK